MRNILWAILIDLSRAYDWIVTNAWRSKWLNSSSRLHADCRGVKIPRPLVLSAGVWAGQKIATLAYLMAMNVVTAPL